MLFRTAKGDSSIILKVHICMKLHGSAWKR